MLKKDAVAAVNALTGKGSVFFDSIKKNLNIHDLSHLNHAAASAALAQKPICGYYFKTVTTTSWVHKLGVEASRDKKPAKNPKNWEERVTVTRSAISSEEMATICIAALTSGSKSYRADTEPTCFRMLSDFPGTYGGETLRRAGGPSNCVKVLVVIRCPQGGNPQIVTHYPVDQDFVNQTAELV